MPAKLQVSQTEPALMNSEPNQAIVTDCPSFNYSSAISSLFSLLLPLRFDFICDLPFVAGQSIHREMVIGDQACLVSFQRLVNVAATLAHRAPMFGYDAASQ